MYDEKIHFMTNAHLRRWRESTELSCRVESRRRRI